MKAVAGCLLLLVGTALTDLASECEMAGFYLELGCTPVTEKSDTKCPRAYTCPDLQRNANTCYYKGKSFEHRTTIPQAMINNPCSKACSCWIVDGVPSFQCAAVDCVEFFNTDIKEQCVRTYDIDSCCSTGKVCGKDEIAKLKTCELDGKTYMEGESYEPKNTRKKCICTAQWNGTIDNVDYCQDINCGIEIHYQDDLYRNCAPITIDVSPICPIGFKCPSNETKVIKGMNVLGVDEKCKFGDLTLSVGDDLDVGDKCTRCSCDIPPLVTCKQKAQC